MAEIDEKYLKPENYVNREMSWLEFDFRILGEARDKSIPHRTWMSFSWCVWHP